MDGIGKGKAEKIEEASLAFWAYWRAGGEKEYTAEIQAKAANTAPAPEKAAIEPGQELADEWQEPGAGERAEAS